MSLLMPNNIWFGNIGQAFNNLGHGGLATHQMKCQATDCPRRLERIHLHMNILFFPNTMYGRNRIHVSASLRLIVGFTVEQSHQQRSNNQQNAKVHTITNINKKGIMNIHCATSSMQYIWNYIHRRMIAYLRDRRYT